MLLPGAREASPALATARRGAVALGAHAAPSFGERGARRSPSSERRSAGVRLRPQFNIGEPDVELRRRSRPLRTRTRTRSSRRRCRPRLPASRSGPPRRPPPRARPRRLRRAAAASRRQRRLRRPRRRRRARRARAARSRSTTRSCPRSPWSASPRPREFPPLRPVGAARGQARGRRRARARPTAHAAGASALPDDPGRADPRRRSRDSRVVGALVWFFVLRKTPPELALDHARDRRAWARPSPSTGQHFAKDAAANTRLLRPAAGAGHRGQPRPQLKVVVPAGPTGPVAGRGADEGRALEHRQRHGPHRGDGDGGLDPTWRCRDRSCSSGARASWARRSARRSRGSTAPSVEATAEGAQGDDSRRAAARGLDDLARAERRQRGRRRRSTSTSGGCRS